MAAGLKAPLARLLCHPIVGEGLRLAFQNQLPSIRFPGIRLHMPRDAVRNQIVAGFFWGIYESAEMRFVRDHLRSDRDVIELGASIGAVSSAIAQRLDPGRRLLCVEANPDLIDVLRENIDANAPHLETEVVNAAIDYRSSEVAFVQAIDNKGGQVAPLATGSGISVATTTLAGLLDRFELGRYALVVDIEGSELGILENDGAALERCDQIVIELHDVTTSERHVLAKEMVDILTSRHHFELRARRGVVCVFDRSTGYAPTGHRLSS